ncbi:M16 family metallopeptidase [Nonomuraea sp. NPDC050536]|uniref:M16 family metallopeptidase n=1 Tax=Nonomuraea sp. NPDC050536 TaxID=3364366 RepID=UPI0037C7AC19
MWESDTLPNGLTAALTNLPRRGMMAARLVFGHGAGSENPDEGGITRILMHAMAGGPSVRGTNGSFDALEQLGATLTADCTHDGASLTAVGPAARFGEILRLMAEAVMAPALTDAEIKRLTLQRAGEIRSERARPEVRARHEFIGAVHLPGSNYARPSGGTHESMTLIDAAAVRKRYARIVAPQDAILLLAGDLSGDVDADVRAAFSGWSGGGPVTHAEVRELRPTLEPIVISSLPSVTQTHVLYGGAGEPMTARAAAALHLAVYALGGWFGSRLNTVLREEKGYSYGAAASFVVRKVSGVYLPELILEAAVDSASTGPAVRVMAAEIERLIDDGLPSGELETVKECLIRSTPLTMQTSEQIVSVYGRLHEQGHGLDRVEEAARHIAAVETDVVQAAAHHLDRARLVMVAVGDPAVIKTALLENEAAHAID